MEYRPTPEQDAETTREAYGKVVAVIIACAILTVIIGYFMWKNDPERTAAPSGNRREIAGPAAGCHLEIALPGGSADVLSRPQFGDMVRGSLPHGTRLDVRSVRVDFVEVGGELAGWIERRYTAEVCE